MIINIHFDGACHNKIGQDNPMGIGVAVFFDGEYQEDQSFAAYVGKEGVRGTSNIAEWFGCTFAMRIAWSFKKVYPNALIQIFSDSEVITNQFNGAYSIKAEEFLPFYQEAKDFATKAGVLSITHVKRNLNKEADRLSKVGLHEMKPSLHQTIVE